jgi:copper resistance protein B
MGLGQTSVVSARPEASYDLMLSQKLGRPTTISRQCWRRRTIRPSGLAADLPIGVSFEQFTGNTPGFVAAAGESTSLVRALVGLRF